MKTSCSDIWTECQSRSELEEDDDDEGRLWPFLKLKGRRIGSPRRPPAAAPFSPLQDAINLGCDEGSQTDMPPEASFQSSHCAKRGTGGGRSLFLPTPDRLYLPSPLSLWPLCRHLHTFLSGAPATLVSLLVPPTTHTPTHTGYMEQASTALLNIWLLYDRLILCGSGPVSPEGSIFVLASASSTVTCQQSDRTTEGCCRVLRGC